MSDSDLIYGYKPVLDALERDPGGVQEVFISDRRKRGRGKVERAARAASATLTVLPEARLNEICGHGNHQGLAARAEPFSYADLDATLAAIRDSKEALALVLDQVQDPQNLGAILRTAGALGVDAVFIPERRAASVNATVMRASAGVARVVPVVQIRNVRDLLDRLKQDERFWISGAVAEGGQPPWEVGLVGRVGLVLGSEGKGIRPRVLEGCDFNITLPLAPGVESLNVSAAAAALLAEVVRQQAASAAG